MKELSTPAGLTPSTSEGPQSFATSIANMVILRKLLSGHRFQALS